MPTKIKYRLAHMPYLVVSTVSGDNSREPVFSERINSDGEYEVYVSGYQDLQAIIQASEQDCLLSNILKRCGVGDYSGLQNEGVFADVSGFPTSIHELHDSAAYLRSFVDSLPADVRANYNDIGDLLSDLSSGKLSLSSEPDTVPLDPVVTDPASASSEE